VVVVVVLVMYWQTKSIITEHYNFTLAHLHSAPAQYAYVWFDVVSLYTYSRSKVLCDCKSAEQGNRHYEFRSALLMTCPFDLHINRARTELTTEIMLLSYSYTACTISYTIETHVRHFRVWNVSNLHEYQIW